MVLTADKVLRLVGFTSGSSSYSESAEKRLVATEPLDRCVCTGGSSSSSRLSSGPRLGGASQ